MGERNRIIMASIRNATRVVWGVPAVFKRISNLPIGAEVKIRYRCEDKAKALVKTKHSTAWGYLADRGTTWEFMPQAINERRQCTQTNT